MIFQLSHANENDDGTGYTIKHAFVQASSLLHAHVFVTLFGFRISPEYYDEYEDSYEPSENQVQHTLQNYSIKRFERVNEDCSNGEHFWHALKPAVHKGLPILLDNSKYFKLIIQYHLPCLQLYEKDPRAFSFYKMEMNTDIYQFKAKDSQTILEYVRQNSDTFNLADFFHGLSTEINWSTIENIAAHHKKCMNTNHIHGEFVAMKCEELQSPIPLFNAHM